MTVLFRHRWASAASGNTPTVEADDAGNGNDVSITFGADQGSWTSDAGGNGIEAIRIAGSHSTKAQLANISANGNIGPSLAGAQKLIYIIRTRVDSGESNGSWVMGIGQTSGFSCDFGLLCNDVGGLSIPFNRLVGGGSGSFSGPFAGTYTLIFDVDTTRVDATSRVRVSVNGAAFTDANACTIPQNEVLSAINSTDRYLCYLNRPDVGRDFDGAIFYDELRIDETITDGGAAAIHASLVADHDAALPAALADLAGAAAAEATATGTLQGVGLEFTLRDIDSGTVKNAVTYARVDVHLASDLSLVKTFTSIATNPAGLMQLSDSLLQTLGVNYFVVGWTSSGSDRFHANATVAGLS